MGFRSYAFRWFFGYSGGTSPEPPVVVCPCPEYKHDATLVNQFTKEQTLDNQFMNVQTLSNQWKRGGCNG